MCVRLEVTILFIGQKKSVINRLKSVNIAALLCLVTYRYAVVWLRTFLFVTFWPRNQHGLHETTFFFPELPETFIETSQVEPRSFGSKQRNTTGNYMCELLGESFSKKENMVWTNQGKCHVLEKNSSEKLFFWWNPGWNFTIFEKNKLKKMRFFA